MRVELYPALGEIHKSDARRVLARGERLGYRHIATRLPTESIGRARWCRVVCGDALVTGATINVASSRKLPWVNLARVPDAARLVTALDEIGMRKLVEALKEADSRIGRVGGEAYPTSFT